MLLTAPFAAFNFEIFRSLLFSGFFLLPAWTTFWVTLASMGIGMVLGLLGAIGRVSRVGPVRWLVAGYLWVFRGTPVLIQIIFCYDATAELTNNAINLPALVAGVLALGVNEGAYMTEIVRAGLLSIDPGQQEASRALGMTYAQTMRRIVIPQALRVIIPPTGNEFISMLKTSSLASAITYAELLRVAGDIYATNLQPVPLLVVASIWYLVLTSVASVGQYYIEQHYARGHRREAAESAFSRIRRGVFGRPRL